MRHLATFDTSFEQRAYDVIDAYMSPEAGFYKITEWAAGHTNNNLFEMIDEGLPPNYGLAKNPAEVLSKASSRKK